MTRPNILFIMADQMSAKALPLYGHDIVHAPALRQLAAEGAVFDNAYCNSPLCGPSRLSMMTGKLPSAVGGYDNAPEFPASQPTFAHYVRLAGYKTCLSGKMHFAGPDQLHGFEERLTTDIYPSDFSWTPNWSDRGARVRFQDMQNVMETGPCLRSLQMDYDDDVATQAQRYLYDRARDGAEAQPFMLTVSFTSPHDPYTARPEFWDRYDTDSLDLPRVPALPAAERDAHSARIFDHYSVGEADVTDATLRKMRHGYYASIDYIDSKLSLLVETLKETGLAENTIVVFASDHGDMMGERGMYYKKCFFEWAARVPLVFWCPKHISPQRITAPVSLVDILPTFADIAGTGEDVLTTDGLSLMPALGGAELPERAIAAEYLAEGVFEPTFMLRQGAMKLFYAETDPPLLFDLDQDPDELNNLATDPAHGAALDALTQTAKATWNAKDLKARIIEDQTRRRLIHRAHAQGKAPAWDFQPHTDASQQWVRAGRWTVEVEADAHLAAPKRD